MASLVVGGVTIPVAVSSPAWTRSDAVDRGRMFDGTFFASESGGATRDWTFATPPVTQADADIYIAALSSPAAKLCSGDILQIPTMCSPELPSGKPTRAAASNRVVLDFMLHEIMSTRVLLRYAPGTTISGESFSRSTVAHYKNSSGGLVQAAINEKRDAHYLGGVPTTLLEDASQNGILHNSDFTNAAWTKTTMTVGTGIADPKGGTAACRLTATGAASAVFQNLADGASMVRTNSIWLRRITGSGTVNLYDALSSTALAVPLTGSWLRFSKTGSASINRRFYLEVMTSGDVIDAFIAQQDNFPFATSEIQTTTVAVTKAASLYSMAAPLPGEMSLYAKFVNQGLLQTTGVLSVFSSAAGAAPYLYLQSTGAGAIRCYHRNATTEVTSDAAVAGAVGDTCEVRVNLFGDGSVLAGGSLNGAAEIVGTQSAANALAAAWSGPLLWFNSAGTGGSHGFTALQSFKIVAGARSLADLRAL